MESQISEYSKLIGKPKVAELNTAEILANAEMAKISYFYPSSCCLLGCCSCFSESICYSLAIKPFLKSFSFSNVEGDKLTGFMNESVSPNLCRCGSTSYLAKFEDNKRAEDFDQEDYSFKMIYRKLGCFWCCGSYEVFSKGENKCGAICPSNYFGVSDFVNFDIRDEENNRVYSVVGEKCERCCFNACFCPKEEIGFEIREGEGRVGSIKWKVEGYKSDFLNCCQTASDLKISCSLQYPENIEFERKIVLLGCSYLIDKMMFNKKIYGNEFNFKSDPQDA